MANTSTRYRSCKVTLLSNTSSTHNAELTFKVQTYKDGTVKQVNIDGKTGKVASITAPDSDDFEKEERRED